MSTDSPATIIDQSPIGMQQVLIIMLCLFFNMLDGFDITMMAVVAKTVGQELSLTADKLGWMFSFALAGMMVGAMFIAPISDIIGRRTMIIISLLLVGVSIMFTAQANSLTEFILYRFISGMGAGSLLACQATLASEYSPEKYRALAVGAVTAGYPMGAMMTSVVAGWLMPEYGWRGMFWFGGIITAAMALVAILFIPESLKYLVTRRPANALARINTLMQRINKPTVDSLPPQNSDAVTAASGNVLTNVMTLLAPKYRRVTLLLWSGFFLSFATLYVLFSWIPVMVENSGFSSQTGRDAFFLFNLGGVIGIFLMGIIAVRINLSLLLSMMLMGAALGMWLFAAIELSLGMLLATIFMIGILKQGGFTGLYSAAAKAYGTSVRTTGVGWCLGLGRTGAVIGPAVAGYLIAAGFSMSAIFYTFAIPTVLAGLIGLALRVR